MIRYPKSLERVALDLHRARCDADYIAHYLMEEYRLPQETVAEILGNLGIQEQDDRSPTQQRRDKHRQRFQQFGM